MVHMCCVVGCTTVDGDGATFFPFPVSARLRREWLRATGLKRAPRAPLPPPAVCSRHFETHLMEMARGKLRLKSSAVPSIFPEGFPTSDLENSNEKTDPPDQGMKTRRGPRKRTSNQENLNTENNIKKTRRKLRRRREKSVTSDSSEESDNSDNDSSKSVSKDDNLNDRNEQNSENSAEKGEENDLVKEKPESSVKKSDKVVNSRKKNSKKLNKSDKSDDSSEKGEQMECRPDFDALFMNSEDQDGNAHDTSAENCTIECVPEAVLRCDEADMSETELHKEDIEDIIANYHIQSNKELADRLKAAQEKEDKEISEKTSKTSNKTDQSTSKPDSHETGNKTDKTPRPQPGVHGNTADKNNKTRDKSQNSEKHESLSSTNDDEEVEFISREVIEPNYIEVPVNDHDSNSVEKPGSNDCMMLLENVQISIDPATLFPEAEGEAEGEGVAEGEGEGERADSPSSSVRVQDERPTEPISLVTSSDESDVVIQEPHIDTVEVSDEDEDDIPLVKLVNCDDIDSDGFGTAKTKQTKKITELLWGQHREYYCYECNFSTSTSGEYHAHKLNHSKVLQMCEICMFTTASVTQFLRHKKKHKDEKRFKCHLCEYRAKHNMSLVYHMKSHENLSGQTLRMMKVSLRSKSESDKSGLSGLSDKCYKKSKKGYRCLRCTFISKSKQDVLRHQKSCNKNEKLQETNMHACDRCDYKTKRSNDLRRHKKRRHKDDEDDDEEFVP